MNIKKNILPNIQSDEIERLMELKESILKGLREHLEDDQECEIFYRKLSRKAYLTANDLDIRESKVSDLIGAFNYLSEKYDWIDIPQTFMNSHMTLKGFVGTMRILKTIRFREDLKGNWIFDWFSDKNGSKILEKLNQLAVMTESLDKDDFFEPFFDEANANGEYFLENGAMIEIKPIGAIDFINGTADKYFCYNQDGSRFRNSFVNDMQMYEEDFIDHFYDNYIDADGEENYLSVTYPRETFTMDCFATEDLGLLFESYSNQDRYFGPVSYIIRAPKLFLAKLNQSKIWNEVYWFPEDNAAIVLNDCLGCEEFDLLSIDLTSIVKTHDFFVKIDGEGNG